MYENTTLPPSIRRGERRLQRALTPAHSLGTQLVKPCPGRRALRELRLHLTSEIQLYSKD